LSEERARQAIAELRKLPTLPSVLTQVMAVASDPESSALDLGRQIASDPSLSAALLRLVNSAYYGFYRQITSIPDAIVLLGFNEVRNVALAATAFTRLARSSGEYDREQLWRHCVAAAVAAERLGKLSGKPLGGAFVGGMLHDIGKVTFDVLLGEKYGEAARLAHERGVRVRETEAELFGIDHAGCGTLLAEHWELPREVVTVIRYHHAPARGADALLLCHAVCLANWVTYQADLGESSNGRAPDLPEASRDALGIGEGQLAGAVQHIQEARDRIEALICVMAE
jgi:HD-like signal output (HDOD) protein